MTYDIFVFVFFSCLKIDPNIEENFNKEDLEITVNFGNILPPPETGRKDQKKRASESKGLWKLCQSQDEEQIEHLQHPVIELFLWYKWKKLGWLFSINMLFCLVYAGMFTGYILNFDDKRCSAM